MSHTPGPWRYQREVQTGFGLSPRTRFEVYSESGPFAHPATCDLEANARLIASAPELLESARDMADMGCLIHDTNEEAPCNDCAACRARIAVAKATGQ